MLSIADSATQRKTAGQYDFVIIAERQRETDMGATCQCANQPIVIAEALMID
jgi:hypothetical protein